MNNPGKESRKFFRSTIKNHRWYDYNFIYTIIIKTLEYMEKNWHKSHYVDANKDLMNIKLAKSYLIELRADEFIDKYMVPIDKEYGSLEIEDGTIKRPIEPAREVVLQAYKNANKDKNRVKRKLYLLLYKELENWWD